MGNSSNRSRSVNGAVGLILAFAVPTTAFSREVGQPSPPPSAEPEPVAKDIVVEGVRPSPVDELTDTRSPLSYSQAVRSRTEFDWASIFTRCMQFAPAKLMRAIIDGPPNRADTREAQARLIRTNFGCHLRYSTFPSESVAPAGALRDQENMAAGVVQSFNVVPLGESVYDRGALLERTIAMYAPGLKLTRAQTENPAVAARFDYVEVPRNRWRLPEDYEYFQVAVCMVRLQPELATRLVGSPAGSKLQNQLGRILISRARLCAGNAKRVRVDPTQFRIYIADALYRWAVAARGVRSLIPEGAV